MNNKGPVTINYDIWDIIICYRTFIANSNLNSELKMGKIWGFLLFFLTSCISTSGLYTGYEKLTDEQKEYVVKCEGRISQQYNDGRVYKITIEQLKQYIAQFPYVLIYDYKPNCTGNFCVNPAIVETFCQQHSCQFCLVACDLDGIFDIPKLSSPILFMDNEPYNTRIQQKYEKRFLEDLTGYTYNERGYGHYILFRNGQYIETYNSYTDAFKVP